MDRPPAWTVQDFSQLLKTIHIGRSKCMSEWTIWCDPRRE